MNSLAIHLKKKSTFFHKVKPHLEMIAALTSGFFILLGWLFNQNNQAGVSVVFYILAFIIGGFAKAKEGIEETISEKKLNVEMLMIFAAIGSAIIGYWTEGAILIFIFAVSGALESYTMNKSQKELTSLMEMQPEEALLINNGMERKVHVSKLSIGDHILIKPGERIPADGIIIKGQSNIDESPITGESIPVHKDVQEEVFAGTVNISGSLTVEITKEAKDTLFQKIIELVQAAKNEKSPSQQFIERFEGIYVKFVLISVGLMMFLPHYLLEWSWNETFYRAMILLVVASPCALVASIMPATLSAISNNARKGILIKGGSKIELLGNIKAIAFDKTGTLTKGKPVVTDFFIHPEKNKDEVLKIVASMENQSNHPLAEAIVQFAKKNDVSLLTDIFVEDVSGWGIQATINGEEWKIGKLAFLGLKEVNHFSQGMDKRWADEGKTVIYASCNGTVIAMFALKDVVRNEAAKAIRTLKRLGIRPIMLTGDNQHTANAIAKECGIIDFQAECLPESKVQRLKELKEKYGITAMVGDGINDAPALATAHIGVAMGDGTGVALETADVVLMKNDLTKISHAIRLSKKMNRIIKQNIIFSILVISLLIASNFFQILDLPLGVIGHEGSTILVILNGLRLLRSK